MDKITSSTKEILTLIFDIVFCLIAACYLFLYVGYIILNTTQLLNSVRVVLLFLRM